MNFNTGFTLIELIVTLAVAAIILTIGVPSFQEALQNNRRTTQVNEIIGAFNIARSEAIKRGMKVTMCKSADSATCDTTACSVTTGNNCWEQGWIIFSDANGDGALDTTTDTIINVHRALGSNLTLRAASAFTNWIAYSSNGTGKGNGSAVADTDANRTFKVCDLRGVDHARFIVVNTTGRATIREKETGDSCP